MTVKLDASQIRVFNEIEKSVNDERHHRGLILENGMKILLISDPDTDKASAAMAVRIGSYSNPDDLPGLAHFCEHMLFLGTKKYPEEDEFDKFINQHAGCCNAWTGSEYTNYHFDVGHEHLKGALDRFAQFFICPLFDASCTNREVNAVNSEHEKNIVSDALRLQMLDRATSDPNHVYAKFETGNKESLLLCPQRKGQDIRVELLKFHEKYYSSNIMALTVIGREPLDELSTVVTELFSDVVNKDVQVPRYDKSPYRKEDMSKKCLSIPVQDMHCLVLSFPIPDTSEHYDSKPDSYISHLLAHEGPGSLLSKLKYKEWVNFLFADSIRVSKGCENMRIEFDLTESGTNHIDDIIAIVFQYIKMLKGEGPKEWIFNELRHVSAIYFRFKDKEEPISYTRTLAERLHEYPIQKVLTGAILMKDNKPELIEQILECLRPDNMKITVSSKMYEGKTDLVEKWYGTNYSLVPVEGSLLEQYRNVSLSDRLHLPEPNEFIPSNLGVKELWEKNPTIPHLIKNDAYSMVWYRQDDTFKFPEAYIYMDFYSPHAYTDPHHCNMLHMFVDLINDTLNEYSYHASTAGLFYGLDNTAHGMELTFAGYDDKQKVLMRKIISKIADFHIDPKRFAILKESYQRNLQNFSVDKPCEHATYYCQILKSEIAWTVKEKCDALPKLTLQNLTDFIPVLLSYLHVESLFYGNMTKDDALDMDEYVVSTLREKASTRSLLPSQLYRRRDIELSRGASYVFKQKHTFQDISAVQVYLQVGMQNTKENNLLDLMKRIVSESFFSTLRTKEQLGYIVEASVSQGNGTQGLCFLIQSDKSPEYLEARIEAYVNHMEEMLESMPDCEFQKYKDGLKTMKLEKPKTMGAQAGIYWDEISVKEYMFKRAEIEAQQLDDITKDELVEFYRQYFHLEAPKRSKLSTYILGKNLDDCPYTINSSDHNQSLKEGLLRCPPLPPSKLIEDFVEFKSGLPLFPRLDPYMDFSEVTISD